jgi:hypothetical protein
MRGEVGMYTRNILVRGASDSDAAGFGGHMMFAGAFTKVQLVGIEVTKAGQKGILGRYPIHFHQASKLHPFIDSDI